jgi:hypothetical protein
LLELIERDLDLEEELENFEDSFKQDEIAKLQNVEGKKNTLCYFYAF